MNRRHFLKLTATGLLGLYVTTKFGSPKLVWAAPIPGGTLDPGSVSKYTEDMFVLPPAMPRTDKLKRRGGKGRDNKNIDYYEIAVREFQQQILPSGLPSTTVWSYGSLAAPGTVPEGGSFNYPAFTIEAKWDRPVRVKWINDLGGKQHLLPVDQTLHWANPLGDHDTRGTNPELYTGPVPIVTHVHGAHTTQDSDGYPEAWYLPDGSEVGSKYDQFKAEFEAAWQDDLATWEPGSAVFQYPNDMRATTLWYHDHTLGMTRLNVYAGPAGFYLIRGGPGDAVVGTLPGPAPALGDPPGTLYYEYPIVIQDRSFNTDGSLFYPDNRAFFEGLAKAQLQIPFTPDPTLGGETSDVAPIWNPEFFGNMMVTNGKTWPKLKVEPRRYRFRFLNGCNSRFLILEMDDGTPFWQIGADGGFLAAPAQQNQLLMAPAERADVIVDFSGRGVGDTIVLKNLGPDEPFGGPGGPVSDPDSTGQVMQFEIVPLNGTDTSTPPAQLVLPAIPALNPGASIRPVSLIEEESKVVFVPVDTDGEFVFTVDGNLVEVPEGSDSTTYAVEGLEGEWLAGPFGPTAALLGSDETNGSGKLWMEPVTENPGVGATESWEIHNHTMDAHPIHIHLVQFQVVGREPFGGGTSVAGSNGPLPGETGFKDTVIAYPGEITRVQATFDTGGLFVWHCHIVEHEDNEMMRPYQVG